MTLTPKRHEDAHEFAVEDVSTGMHASGFGQIGDGRSFSFHIERNALAVEIYRPRLNGVVPQAEDVVAVAHRTLTEIDLDDERSIIAAVRDAITGAQPVTRPAR